MNFSVAPVGLRPFAVNVITERDQTDKTFFHRFRCSGGHVMACGHISTTLWILFVSSSLVRATLVLIPLLGIHEVVFMLLADECMEGRSRYASIFVNLTLSSFQVLRTMASISVFVLNVIHFNRNASCGAFQGFLVAVLYCFANGEVRFFLSFQ